MRMPLQQPATSLKADILGGLTTFVTMASIVVVNPGILATPGTEIPFSGALTNTVLVAFSMTLLMGLYPRLPFAVAPGMGLMVTLVRLGHLDHRAALLLLGVVVAVALMRRGHPMAFRCAIPSVTACAWGLGRDRPLLPVLLLHRPACGGQPRRREVTPVL